MKVLGLDVGKSRIGLAVSDGMGITAQGLSTLERRGIDQDIGELKKLIKIHTVKEVVVGLPLNMDGSLGGGAREVVDFADRLKLDLSLPVNLWDERLTTKEAEAILLAADISRKKRKRVVDRLAAQLILQSYLDSKRGQRKESTK